MKNETLERIVKLYIRKIRPHAKEELDFFRTISLDLAIHQASLAINKEGKRYSHQRRLKKSVLSKAHQILEKEVSAIKKIKSFEELHDTIEKAVLNIQGIGELYAYDTSLRIGANLGLLPKKVYVHAGTREGARALGINTRTKTLNRADLPKEVHKLDPYEIEDLLCIFKDEFAIIEEELPNRSRWFC